MRLQTFITVFQHLHPFTRTFFSLTQDILAMACLLILWVFMGNEGEAKLSIFKSLFQAKWHVECVCHNATYLIERVWVSSLKCSSFINLLK